MVAGARGHHTAGPILLAESTDAYVRTADLERPGALKVLALEMDRRLGHRGDRPRRLQGSLYRDAVEQPPGRLDVADRDLRYVRADIHTANTSKLSGAIRAQGLITPDNLDDSRCGAVRTMLARSSRIGFSVRCLDPPHEST